MILRRTGYLLLLLGMAAAFLLSDHYFPLYALVLLLLLPVASLVLSRPLLKGVSLSLSALPNEPEREQEAHFVLTLHAAGPVTRTDCVVTVENHMTGTSFRRRVTLPRKDGGDYETIPLPTEHCGWVVCTVERGRLWDFLGLFARKLTLPPPAAAAVYPVFLEGGPLPESLREKVRQPVLRPRPGGGPGEDYELRDYRPGDPLRSIHWKCSARRDDLVVREVLEEVPSAMLLTFDHVGPPEVLDQVLDRVQALSRRLLEREQRHFLLWMDRKGRLQWADICSSSAYRSAIKRILSTAMGEGASTLDHVPVELPGWTGTVRRFHVTARLWQEGGTA